MRCVALSAALIVSFLTMRIVQANINDEAASISSASVDFLEQRLQKFKISATEAQFETSHLTMVLRKYPKRKTIEYFSSVNVSLISDPNFRLEWKLRFPDKFDALQFTDLADITNARLLDEALWTILRNNFDKLLHGGPQATRLLASFKDFLGDKSRQHIFSEKHGDWWSYLTELKSNIVSNDPMLNAYRDFTLGLKKMASSRLRLWIEARFFLNAHVATRRYLNAFDERVRSELFREYAKNPKKLNLEIEQAVSPRLRDLGVLTLVEQKTQLLFQVAQHWRHHKKWELAAESLQIRADLIDRSKKEMSDDEYLELGDLWFQAARYERALVAYRQALSRSDTRFKKGEAYGAMGLATLRLAAKQKKDRVSMLEWSAEYLRLALVDLVSSDRRDLVLKHYADVLKEFSFYDAVEKVYEALYRGGSSEENQIDGLFSLLRALDARMSRKSAGLGSQVDALSRYASLLSSFAKARPYRNEIGPFYLRAIQFKKDLGQEKNSVIEATLFEVQNVLENREKKSKSSLNKDIEKGHSSARSKRGVL